MTRLGHLAPMLAVLAVTVACGGTDRGRTPGGIVAISGGDTHLCALRADGTASCVRVDEPPVPLELDALPVAGTPLRLPEEFTSLRAIASGRDRSCGLREDGSIVCVGHVPDAPTVSPIEVHDAASIGMGSMHLAVVRPGNVVEVFDLRDGQMAVHTRRTAEGHLEFDEPPDSVDLASRFGCATTEDGGVSCWGTNLVGECGNGSNGLENEPVRVASALDADSPSVATAFEECVDDCRDELDDVVRVVARGSTACALLDGDGVACWGASPSQLFLPAGDDPAYARRPVMLASSDDASSVCLGAAHVCIVRDRAVLCRGAIVPSDVLTEIPSLAGAEEIACTATSVCARDRRGLVRCHGPRGADAVRLR